MVGTPKQIKWAEEIKATYMEKMDEAKRYLERIAETGKDDDVYPTGAMIFVECYHNDALYDNVRREMKDSDLYRKIRSVPKGTPEKREAISAFRKAVAKEALRRLDKGVKEKCSEESASKWIDSRMH